MPRKMTMKGWEKSSMDKKMDASKKHGKEGSKRDLAADKKALKAYNAKKAKRKK